MTILLRHRYCDDTDLGVRLQTYSQQHLPRRLRSAVNRDRHDLMVWHAAASDRLTHYWIYLAAQRL